MFIKIFVVINKIEIEVFFIKCCGYGVLYESLLMDWMYIFVVISMLWYFEV